MALSMEMPSDIRSEFSGRPWPSLLTTVDVFMILVAGIGLTCDF